MVKFISSLVAVFLLYNSAKQSRWIRCQAHNTTD